MIKITEYVNKSLPLYLETIEWDDPSLTIIGKEWSFYSLSSWRIVYENKLICGCYDKEATDKLKLLESSYIENIWIQSNFLTVDPVFIFANEYILELFSTTYLEPWIFRLSSKDVYVASPSA
ncbi:MAG: hypothetical protein BGO14_00830 [Chlamydiales bacterium 38-26]|nr:hypothetical protein [Chlamydiales bacterium]OJV07266.1 MAG: hypothetical protein BGO14_00830 [Chlamydiales bacterium 38-26]